MATHIENFITTLSSKVKVNDRSFLLLLKFSYSEVKYSNMLNIYIFYLQRENDKDHKVRLAIGNGVRAEVWREFLERFGKIKVQEFYASTEGNVGFVNYAGKIGAIGRVNFFHRVYTSFCFFVCLPHVEINQTKCVYEHLIKFNLSLKSAVDPLNVARNVSK